MRLFLIRHPKPNVATGTCYGQTDLDLAEGWEIQAEALKNWLSNRLQGQTCFQHSPLKRASSLGDYLHNQSSIEHELVELNFADWEGLLWKDIPHNQIEAWGSDLEFSAPFNGESLNELRQRLSVWWTHQQNQSFDNLVVVTHSGVIKVLVSMLCGWPMNKSYLIDVGFCSVTELSIQRGSSAQDAYIMLKRLGAGDWVM
ncbi:histidine phosphatase family protein [Marinomonas algicola]|uniref:histidine phosphatase family protein n=1 Tax=Marinomonas algicola TaxID=2773454 RepID=UPI00174E391A|nr:histidine phosphatase family protein [Marinomonas algicola]